MLNPDRRAAVAAAIAEFIAVEPDLPPYRTVLYDGTRIALPIGRPRLRPAALSPEQVREVRRLYALGQSAALIADAFQISVTAVVQIARREVRGGVV